MIHTTKINVLHMLFIIIRVCIIIIYTAQHRSQFFLFESCSCLVSICVGYSCKVLLLTVSLLFCVVLVYS